MYSSLQCVPKMRNLHANKTQIVAIRLLISYIFVAHVDRSGSLHYRLLTTAEQDVVSLRINSNSRSIRFGTRPISEQNDFSGDRNPINPNRESVTLIIPDRFVWGLCFWSTSVCVCVCVCVRVFACLSVLFFHRTTQKVLSGFRRNLICWYRSVLNTNCLKTDSKFNNLITGSIWTYPETFIQSLQVILYFSLRNS